jgi:hypothetical protein
MTADQLGIQPDRDIANPDPATKSLVFAFVGFSMKEAPRREFALWL